MRVETIFDFMDIFEGEKSAGGHSLDELSPLADRMRPTSLDEFVGQEKIVAKGTPLRLAIEEDRVSSLVFWGPPGTGKTTLARLIARSTDGQFVPFSAVTAGIKEVKQVLSKAANYYQLSGRRTYVFIDEIHRFNKAQQDAFLPYVEKGDIILIGATTENPSFEVNSALLSRMRVYVLKRLDDAAIKSIIARALDDDDRGLGKQGLTISGEGTEFLAAAADGDARRALSLLESTAEFVGESGSLTAEALQEVHQKGTLLYDRAGEEHFNLISALHKTIRGGDPDASLYWLARMLESGEEPLYVMRRLIRFASEDIGLADPYALTLALNARDTYHFLGSPEGELAIAQLVVYMACAPKSNSIYTAFAAAQKDARERGSLPVPLWLRNAPTQLMKTIGYGDGYQYAHNYEGALTDQQHFPDELAQRRCYHPTEVGREKRMHEYLDRYLEFRQSASGQPTESDE
jgi:putative ATPase